MVESNAQTLDLIFHALADATRRSILNTISNQERRVSDIAEPFKMSLAAISKHLKVLERAKLVRRRKEGSSYYISLNAEALMTAEEWLNHYQVFWQGRLDGLKDYLEQEEE